MKARRKIGIILGVALAVVIGFLLFGRGNGAQRELEQTKQRLRAQGYRIALGDFNLSTSEDERRRAAQLGLTSPAVMGYPVPGMLRPAPALREPLQLMKAAGKDVALVAWSQKTGPENGQEDIWSQMRDALRTDNEKFEAARQAAISGPIRFEPIGRGSPSPLMPYLAACRQLETTFASETLLALHDGDFAAAWTNLLASTCFVTAYTPEPIEIAHLVRMGCERIAYETLWNALQSHEWTDAQLAELQSRWEHVDFWSGLPDTAAYTRASMAAAMEQDRRQPLSLGMPLKQALMSPRYTLPSLLNYWHQVQYRNQGSYIDEKALLLEFCDREAGLKKAVQASSWIEMRKYAVVTNVVSLNARSPSPAYAMMRLGQIATRTRGRGQGLLGQAAEAESRRRLMVTALALERYRIRHGKYPGELRALAPEFLKAEPIDFMDETPAPLQSLKGWGFCSVLRRS